MPTTLTVTAADSGRTLANAGTLIAVRFMAPPTGYGGVFQLVDRYMPEAMPGWPVPKQIVCIDVSANSIPPANNGTSMFPGSEMLN